MVCDHLVFTIGNKKKLPMSKLNKRSKPNGFQKKSTTLNKPKKVLSMLLAMEQKAAQDAEDFFTSGRTGRRNAMADILGIHATTTTADMPEKLQALTTKSPSPENKQSSMNTASSSQSIDCSSSVSISNDSPSEAENAHRSKQKSTNIQDIGPDELPTAGNGV